MAITLVQSVGNAGNGTSLTTTISAASAGNLLVAFVCANVSTLGTINTPAGYTLAVGLADGGGASPTGAIFYKVAAGGETAFTYTQSGSSQLMRAEVAEFTGVSAWVLDKTATSDPAGSGTTCSTGSTGTLAASAEVAFAGIALINSQTSRSWDSGFTSISSGNTSPVTGYLITSATTALNPTATYAISDPRVGLIATFKQAVIVANPTMIQARTTFAAPYIQLPPVGKWGLRTEVAWSTDPLTRPTEGYVGSGGDWSLLSDVSDGIMEGGPTIRRGTKLLTAGLDPGTSSGTAENAGRHLDPSYSASDYAPDVKLHRRLRHVLTNNGNDIVLGTGFIERFTPRWMRKVSAIDLPTKDLFGMIAGVTLPPSVLDVVTRGLDPSLPVTVPTAYWPMHESVFTETADDVIGNLDGTYVGPVGNGSQLTAYDPRPSPKFAKPGTVNGDQIDCTAMQVTGMAVPDTFSFSCWFKWENGPYDNVNPAVAVFQDGAPPTTDPAYPTASPNQILMYLSQDLGISGRHHINIRVQNGSSIAIVKVPVAAVLLDGLPHHLAFTVVGSTKTITTWMDGFGGTATDTGISSTVALSTLNVSAIIATLDTLGVGWGIDWQTTTGTEANAAVVGEAAYWANHVLTGTEAQNIVDAGTEAWDGDTTDQRLDRYYDLAGVDPADRDFDVGTQTCGPTILGEQNMLAAVANVVRTEQGAHFVDRNGRARFRARPASPAVVQTFTDDPSGDHGVPCAPIAPDWPDGRVINTVVIGRENGADQTVIDQASIDIYGPSSGAIGGKLQTVARTADDARATGAYIIAAHSEQVMSIPSVTIEAVDKGVNIAAMTEVEIGDLVATKHRPPGDTVEVLGIEAMVEAVEYAFPSATEFRTTYTLGDGTPA